jgi:hypothetical protein
MHSVNLSLSGLFRLRQKFSIGYLACACSCISTQPGESANETCSQKRLKVSWTICVYTVRSVDKIIHEL